MKRFQPLLIGLAEAGAILALTHWVSIWAAWAVAAIVWWWRSRQLDESLAKAIEAIALVSLVLVLAINPNLIGEILVAAGFAAWRYGQSRPKDSTAFQVGQAGWLQFMTLLAGFGVEAIWHWPVGLVLVAIYLASVVIAMEFFAGERAARALASAWGLIVTEASLLFSIWLVAYVLPKNLLLVPQPAVVITAIGYCFGSIYLAHKDSKLSKARLAEYAIIGLCLVVIVAAGTRWSGTI